MSFITYLFHYIKNNHLMLCVLPVAVCTQIGDLCVFDTTIHPFPTAWTQEHYKKLLQVIIHGINAVDSPKLILQIAAKYGYIIKPEQFNDLLNIFITYNRFIISECSNYNDTKMIANLAQYYVDTDLPPIPPASSTIKYLMLMGIALSVWGLLYCAYVYSKIPL